MFSMLIEVILQGGIFLSFKSRGDGDIVARSNQIYNYQSFFMLLNYSDNSTL